MKETIFENKFGYSDTEEAEFAQRHTDLQAGVRTYT